MKYDNNLLRFINKTISFYLTFFELLYLFHFILLFYTNYNHLLLLIFLIFTTKLKEKRIYLSCSSSFSF